MFSRILIKLIDEAIIPAITLVAVRFLSVTLIAKYYGIYFELGSSGIVYNSHDDFIFVNSYSVLAMVCVLALGLVYVLIKSHVFHETHVTPKMSAKLFSFKLDSFIQTSFDIYPQAAIWWLYSLLMFFATLVMHYFDLIYVWLIWVSLGLTLLTAYLLIVDIEKEVEINSKENPGDVDDSDEVILHMEV